MKALDTPVLLAILHDSPTGRELLKSLRGEELATTELNLYELRATAAGGPPAARTARDTALARLRRRITVLPITAQSVSEAGRYLHGAYRNDPWRPLILGTLAAAGCSEWITTRAYAPAKGKLPFKVRIV